MTTLEKAYVGLWLLTCFFAALILIKCRRSISLLRTSYWRSLLTPWKLVSFLVAGSCVTFLGPYTEDLTWDWIDGGLMSILAYTTAPWSVGIVYRSIVRMERRSTCFAAVVIALFSFSWVYDGYLILRDGVYPDTWLANMALSSVLYFCAGLFWNLEWIEGEGTILAFRRPGWPAKRSEFGFSKIAWMALPFTLLVGWIILSFVTRFPGQSK